MVVKSRLLLAVASALTLVLTASAPMFGATREAKPAPLRSGSLVRLKDIGEAVMRQLRTVTLSQ